MGATEDAAGVGSTEPAEERRSRLGRGRIWKAARRVIAGQKPACIAGRGTKLAIVRAVVQRVSRARVLVDGDVVGEIGSGYCVLLGVADTDDAATAERLAGGIARLRVFENEDGRFDRSLLDANGGALVVSQFTLIADTAKGNRPSFSHAALPDLAEPLYERFCEALRELGVRVQTGVFGARMKVELVNDGPVTIVLDT
jgi:D-aminoacyl-tRNA deacylase